MSVNAAKLRAGMSLACGRVYVYVERVAVESQGMIAAYVRSATGDSVPVRFHSNEILTVGV